MSLPVDPMTALQAVHMAGRAIGGAVGAVRSIADSSPFADVLQHAEESTAATSESGASDSASFQQRFVKWLTSLGLPAGTSLQWSLDRSGNLQLDNDHPRAAELQLRLQENPTVQNELTQHVAGQFDNRWTVRLPETASAQG